MKKYLFLAAAAAMFAACSNEDVLVDEGGSTSKDLAIAFTSFTEKVTRAENSSASYDWMFSNHHDDFSVWGYKNTSTTAVFDGSANSKVTVTASGDPVEENYSYSPVRYWDKAADKYEFYACAPAGSLTFVTPSDVATTQKAGYFKSTSAHTLIGANITVTTGDDKFKYVESFKGFGDTDIMIAAPCAVTNANFLTSSPVELLFNHIFSRLNVTIAKDETALGSATVCLKSLEVEDLLSKGEFDESMEAANGSAKIARWKNQITMMTYTASPINDAANGIVVSSTPQYVLQSLVIPQEAEYQAVKLDGKANSTLGITAVTKGSSKPYLKVVYTIKAGSAETDPVEEYTAYYNLAAAFGMDGTEGKTKIAFNEGWQNTLNIKIAPQAITFTANVAEWADHLNKTWPI